MINTYSGHENKVKTNLRARILFHEPVARFRRVVVPTEQVIETKDGQKVQIEKRVLRAMCSSTWISAMRPGPSSGPPGVTGSSVPVRAGASVAGRSRRILHTQGAGGGPAAKSQAQFSLGSRSR